MKIKFIGATEHLTGSCSWLKYTKTGEQFLVDCGMHQGNIIEHLNNQEFPFDPSEISGVFLTHAHIDHCGLIPKLYRQGFKGKVHTTSATAKLAKIVLENAASLSTENNSNLYTKNDVAAIVFNILDEQPDFYWGKAISISKGITVSCMMSSHILGATAFSISWAESPISTDIGLKKTMFFSGDIGNNTDDHSYLPILKPNKNPFPKTDYILIESTYGSRERDNHFKSQENRLNALEKIFSRTIHEKNGKVIIPTFSIHRSQELMIDIALWLTTLNIAQSDESSEITEKPIKVLFHSPMIAKANQVYFEELTKEKETKNGVKKLYLSDTLESKFNGDFDRIFQRLFNTARKDGSDNNSVVTINNHKISICSKPKINNHDDYNIIVASSGMCIGGPICTYLDIYQYNPKNTIVITGYQSSGTRGEAILNKTDSPPNISAEVEDLSSYYSGHADKATLLNHLFYKPLQCKQESPATVFINHGNRSAKEELQAAIKLRAQLNASNERDIKDVIIAETHSQWFNLETHQYENEKTNIDIDDIFTELKSVRKLLAEMVVLNRQLLSNIQRNSDFKK